MKRMNSTQVNELETLKVRDPKMQMRWDHDNNAPAMLKGRLAEPFNGPAAKLAVAAALDFLEDRKHLFRMQAPREELGAISKTEDAKGNLCVALQQKYKGIPVDGATVRVHFSPDKSVYQISNKYESELDLDDVEPTSTLNLKSAHRIYFILWMITFSIPFSIN